MAQSGCCIFYNVLYLHVQAALMLPASLDTCRPFCLHLQHTAPCVSFSSALSEPGCSAAARLRQVKTRRMVHVSVYWTCAGAPPGGALSEASRLFGSSSEVKGFKPSLRSGTKQCCVWFFFLLIRASTYSAAKCVSGVEQSVAALRIIPIPDSRSSPQCIAGEIKEGLIFCLCFVLPETTASLSLSLRCGWLALA